jgi:FkbM family methyltransferase
MKHWWNRARVDLLELVLISAVVGLLVHVLEHRFASRLSGREVPEGAALAEKYGPDHNSEHEEEWIVRDFFNDRQGGVFVDVGANHYRGYSNTYYLETSLGWSGLAIEPQKAFEADYLKYRPRSRFLPFFVSDVSNEEATMYYVRNNRLVTSSERTFTERYGDVAELRTPTTTLDDLFARENVTAIDFLSMDIELGEPKALRGFDVERFRPALVCIEAHPEVRQQILDYFSARHYVVAGKYLRVDTHNLYFVPASAQPG